MADHTQLIQLFLNLLSNSLKFRSNQPLIVHIGAEKQKNEWLFFVRDNGIGFDLQFRDRIFVLFQRLNLRDEYPGTGVGLAISKKIIERHGGKIWVDSQIGQGTTFYFTIPAKEDKCL
jgi:chemotaxis family two-component system sensor kinase Cph1